MKIHYRLLILAVLFLFLSGCGAAYYLPQGISDSHNQYYKHEMHRERQSLESYRKEREKILKKETVSGRTENIEIEKHPEQ